MSKYFKRKVYYILIFAFLVFGFARLYYHLTDDFRLANVMCELPFEASWKDSALNLDEYQNLKKIFEQKFSYMGKGAQCYAFVSEDGQYVLKFFKFKHLKPNLFIEYLLSIPPFQAYKQRYVERKKRKLIGVFNSYDLAFRENRQISELIYLHLVPTQHLQLTAHIIDKIGLKRIIHLDDIVFLVQKKGEILRTRLRRLLNQDHLQEAKQAIASIVEMYISEYKKGICDHDHGVLHNTGFIGNQPFHLDVGKLNKDERMQQTKFYKKDLEHLVWKMDRWIKTYYPHYYSEFSMFLAQQYQKWTGETLDIQSIDSKCFKKKRKLFGL